MHGVAFEMERKHHLINIMEKGGKMAPLRESANGIDPVVLNEYHSYLKSQYSAPRGPVDSIQYAKS